MPREIEFVCCNPAFDDATSPSAQEGLMNALSTVPGVVTYRQDWGEGQTSLAAIIKHSAPKHAHQTVKRLAKRHGVAIDLTEDVPESRLDDLYAGQLENVTHVFGL